MTISLKITDSIKTIEKNINSAIAEYINQTLSNNSNNIIKDIKVYVPSWIKSQPEIISLLSNDTQSLAGYFGIPIERGSIVEMIVSSVTDSLSFKFVKYKDSLARGGFEVYIQPDNFLNLLSLPQGHTIYKGGDLHWLDWLLLRGDEIIISNYYYNPAKGFGRSGLGNMVSGDVFRVPPQYSGTSSDNFVTRALIGDQQDKIITSIFKKYLG
jgi:hypothetical protein